MDQTISWLPTAAAHDPLEPALSEISAAMAAGIAPAETISEPGS